jgi:hypothetical protein
MATRFFALVFSRIFFIWGPDFDAKTVSIFLHFSVNSQETRLFIRGFSSHATVLTNTQQLPIGQWLNASGVHLVN